MAIIGPATAQRSQARVAEIRFDESNSSRVVGPAHDRRVGALADREREQDRRL
jgi:hypothetical protein